MIGRDGPESTEPEIIAIQLRCHVLTACIQSLKGTNDELRIEPDKGLVIILNRD